MSCTRRVAVGRTKLNSKGAFRVTVPMPAGLSLALFRASTSVRSAKGKTASTLTLPRGVAR